MFITGVIEGFAIKSTFKNVKAVEPFEFLLTNSIFNPLYAHFELNKKHCINGTD